jgi:hypothetical protein
MQNTGPSSAVVLDKDRRQRGQTTTMLSLPTTRGLIGNYQQRPAKLKSGLPLHTHRLPAYHHHTIPS